MDDRADWQPAASVRGDRPGAAVKDKGLDCMTAHVYDEPTAEGHRFTMPTWQTGLHIRPGGGSPAARLRTPWGSASQYRALNELRPEYVQRFVGDMDRHHPGHCAICARWPWGRGHPFGGAPVITSLLRDEN